MNNILWNQIVEAHYRDIYAYAVQFLGNHAEAEDVTQDTFLKAGKRLSSVREPDKIRAWLFQIARNCCIDRTRFYRRFLHSETMPEETQETSPDFLLAERTRRAIQKLPRRQREVFLLRIMHDFSTEDTATMLHIRPGSVKSHLHRAISSLQKVLQENATTSTTGSYLSSSTSQEQKT